jgi:uncharacterized membrane protein
MADLFQPQGRAPASCRRLCYPVLMTITAVAALFIHQIPAIVGGLLIAGSSALLPGRLMHQVIFGA